MSTAVHNAPRIFAAPPAAHGTIAGSLSVKGKDGSVKHDASEVVVYVADLNEQVTGVQAALL
jgi:hypothetical protein